MTLDDALAWIERHPGLGQWLGALATFAAVAVTLYLARSESRVRLAVSAEASLDIFSGRKGHDLRALHVTVVNHGMRPVIVGSFGFATWPRTGRTTMPLVGFLTETVPGAPLAHGEAATFVLPLDRVVDSLVRTVAPTPLHALRLCVVVRTTVGRSAYAFVGPRARRELLDELGRRAVVAASIDRERGAHGRPAMFERESLRVWLFGEMRGR